MMLDIALELDLPVAADTVGLLVDAESPAALSLGGTTPPMALSHYLGGANTMHVRS